MKIVIDINHPANVHYFKNFIWEMEKRGHKILIAASNKDVSCKLLNIYGFSYADLGSYGSTLIKKILNVPFLDWRMYKRVKGFQPDIFLGFSSIRAAHVSKLMKKPYIVFDDDEYTYIYYYPCANVICGFSGFKKTGKKVLKLNSYKELAYLHPNFFEPKIKTIEEAGISKDQEFVILRFVAWNAFHDYSRVGFNLENKRKLVEELEKYANVFISSETSLPYEFEKYRLPLSLEKVHHLLFYAKLLVCDSQTMTTEAGVLGTPAIRCNSFVGKNDMGNFVELEQKYGLIFNYDEPDKAIKKAVELARKPGLKEEWRKKRKTLLKDKIDATAFMIWFVENYPESFQEMKEHTEIQDRFR